MKGKIKWEKMKKLNAHGACKKQKYPLIGKKVILEKFS